MLGRLQTSIYVKNTEIPIRTDYRDILRIFEAFNDYELTDSEKWQVCVRIMIKDITQITDDNYNDVLLELSNFINFGTNDDNKYDKPLLNWEQDEHLIFSAINNIARTEVRSIDFVHWWTFMGYFNCIGEGLLSEVIHIRSKKLNGKKLEKNEEEFYKENRKMIDIKPSKQVQIIIDEDKERIKKIIGMR